jgi:predicted ribosome quality control (RQC) complex YloA/Tae2 family protein
MSLSAVEITRVVADLAPRLEGGRIERIDQPDPHKLTLTIRGDPGLHWLLLCADARFSRMHLLTRRPAQARPAAGFCNAVRQHMTGGVVRSIQQVHRDRVVLIESAERDRMMRPHRVALAAELTGFGSNLLLLDESDRILALLRRERARGRDICVGAVYSPPERPERVPAAAREDRFVDRAGTDDDPFALSRAIQDHYALLESDAEFGAARNRLSSAVRKAARRAARKVDGLSTDLAEADRAESIRQQGELLKAAMADVSRGMGSVTVPDVFSPDRREVTIPLDPALSPAENLERIFARYKKAKAGGDMVRSLLEEARETLASLRALARAVDRASTAEAVREAEESARALGIALTDGRPAPQQRLRSGPRAFESLDGLEILVARSARQNDELTFGIARGNDYWLHLRAWPGPHVVVRSGRTDRVPHEALLDAAHLAAHFSKIRGATSAEVVCTQCKNVRRVRGAPPGKVSYSAARTLHVQIDPERTRRLLGRAR